MVRLRSIDDVDENKKWIDESIVDAFKTRKWSNKKVSISIENPYVEDRDYSLEEQKKALMSNRNLSRPVKGDMILTDSVTGEVLDKKLNLTLAQAPYHTGRNAIVSNGISYSNPSNQLRLRPGAYTRKKANDEIETHFNLVSGTGSGFRVSLEPESGIFNLRLGTSNIKLYSLLKAMGVTDEELQSKWGEKIFSINKDNEGDIVKLYEKLVPYGNRTISDAEKTQAILEVFKKAKMDGDVNVRTLGKPFDTASPEALVTATEKIIKVNKGEVEEDDRDSLLYKKIYSSEDFYREKITKDAGNIGKALLNRVSKERKLDKVPSGYFTKQLWGVIKSDPSVSPNGTLAQPLEEINPLDMYDQHHKVTIMGEGGINDMEVVTLEARNVHPSDFGFIDFVRTPESSNVGIDKRLAFGTKKGDDNLLYKEFVNTKNGKREWLTPLDVYEKTVAFPNEMNDKSKTMVDVLRKGRQLQVPREEVDFYLEHPAEMFSTYDNLIPMPETIQGNRMILAGKAMSITLPIVNGDAPYVQFKNPFSNNSFEKDIADKVVNKTARTDGIVTSVTKDNIFVGKVRHGLYNNFPLNLKTSINMTPLVKIGDKVKKGDMLANSNFSDKEGTLSVGKNLESIYIPYKGWNYDDGIVLSQSGSKKLTSEQTYTYEYYITDADSQFMDKLKFTTTFPTLHVAAKLENIDDNGVVKQGSTVQFDDPVILAMEHKPPSSRDIQLGNLHKSLKNMYRDVSLKWEHHSNGTVLDVYKGKDFAKVVIKTETPANIGDKLTGRYGNKGVVSLILPDDKMPHVKGKDTPIDIILNTIGVPSRINPDQMHEAMLGKIVKEKGVAPYVMPSMQNKDIVEFVQDELKKNNISETEKVVFPDENDREITATVGQSYIWKLSKLSEGEMKKRDIGGYDSDEQPIKGKSEQGQAMKMGTMEINALLGHGAKENLREISTIKGQRYDEFWKRFKLGMSLPSPNVPFVYKKFVTMLQGAGINVEKRGDYQHLLPMTDTEILRRSAGAIEKPELLYAKNMLPVKGGLFDVGLTGGTSGQKWNHITLKEPLPNPVMEDPLKKILGVNQVEFDKMIKNNSFEQKVKEINLDTEIDKAQKQILTLGGQKRNDSFKKLNYLQTLKQNGLTPSDLILHNVPVIPPIFRPVSVVGTKGSVSPGSSNLLYKDLMTSNVALEMMKQEVPDTDLGQERITNYKALKAVVGLGDPINIKNKSKGITGFIAEIVGDQPKTGYFQKKVFNKTQDLVARGVASPDPTLSIDEIGIPRKAAWELYRLPLLRRMTQLGIEATASNKEIEEESPRAYQQLLLEMKERPILMNRNPSLHKFNIMAFHGKIHDDNTIKASPPICKGFNLDFDGDQVNLFVPVTPEAVKEAEDTMLPSKNLFHIKDRKVHYIPAQGAILGLYAMTNPAKSTKLVKSYNTISELKSDFDKGIIKATDLVEVKQAY